MSDDFDVSIDLDLSDVDALKEWEPVPDGTYLLTIEDVELEKAKSADKFDNIKMVFGVDEPENRKIFKWFNLGEKSLPYLKKFLEELFGTELSGPLSLRKSELIGKQIVATVKVVPRNDDKDKMTNEIVGSSWTNVPF